MEREHWAQNSGISAGHFLGVHAYPDIAPHFIWHLSGVGHKARRTQCLGILSKRKSQPHLQLQLVDIWVVEAGASQVQGQPASEILELGDVAQGHGHLPEKGKALGSILSATSKTK